MVGIICPLVEIGRACVSTGARGAWRPRNFRTSRLAAADFGGHPQVLFCRADGTRSFKFLTQTLMGLTDLSKSGGIMAPRAMTGLRIFANISIILKKYHLYFF